MKAVFITGTGTDIGKTYVSALIMKDLLQRKVKATYFKPILSGYMPEHNDIDYVKTISGLQAKYKEINCYSFDPPLSPHLAAKQAKIIIEPQQIIHQFKALETQHDFVLVEGAGGIICPFDEEEDRLLLQEDIIKLLDLEVILVCDAGLGTINHSLLAVHYLKAKGIPIKGIILNRFQRNNPMHVDNQRMINKLSGVDILATVQPKSEAIEWITKLE